MNPTAEETLSELRHRQAEHRTAACNAAAAGDVAGVQREVGVVRALGGEIREILRRIGTDQTRGKS